MMMTMVFHAITAAVMSEVADGSKNSNSVAGKSNRRTRPRCQSTAIIEPCQPRPLTANHSNSSNNQAKAPTKLCRSVTTCERVAARVRDASRDPLRRSSPY